MNSPFVMEQAERLAQRLTGDTGFSVADRIRLAYRLALTRRPTVSEQARAVEFLGAGQPQDWRLFCQMLLCLNEFAFVE